MRYPYKFNKRVAGRRLVMIDQFIIAYPDLDDSVRATQFKKVARQIKRIEEELG